MRLQTVPKTMKWYHPNKLNTTFYTILILIGVLQLSPSESKAQRIEYDSLGMPYASTDYTRHREERNMSEVKRLAIYTGIIAGSILLSHHFNQSNNEWNQSMTNLGRQSYYVAGAVFGAGIVIGIHKLQVRTKNKIGL